MNETPQQAARRLADKALLDGFEAEALHVYTDRDGKPLHWRIRAKHPATGDKWIRPMRLNGTRYVLGEPEYPDGKPIYRLHEILARHTEVVIVCEGEWCADALAKVGVLATTSGAADSAGKADWHELAGRSVTLWPDNDEAGQRYAEAVAGELRALGCMVRLIDVTTLNLPPKGDAVDWLATHPGATATDILALPTRLPASDGQATGTGGQTQSAEPAWPAPTPLPELPGVGPFPIEILPDALQGWVADAAERAQFPVDFAAAASMVALGSVLGRKLGIRLKAHDNWTEYANVWGGLIGCPSSLKSPALREALRPLKLLQTTADAKHAEAVQTYQAEHQAFKLRRDARRKTTAKALEKNPDADINLGSNDEPEAPVARAYWTSNVNEASLGALLQHNPNGLLIERDELPSLLTSLEDDGRADLRGMLLSGWSGNEGYRFDRIQRGTIAIPKYALSIVGGIQPGPLDRYVRGAFSGERADGLLQRFQLLVWPDAVPFRHVDRYPKKSAKNTVRELFERVDAMDPLAMGAKDDYGDDPPFVRLSDEAQMVFDGWYTAYMQQRRATEANGGESGPLTAHFGKYPGLVGKLALIIHVADDPDAKQVSEQTMRKALAWIEYLTPHARRIYHAAECPETGVAKLLLARLRAGDLPDRPFGARDIYRKGWHGLTEGAAVKKACRLLVEFGWLIEIDPGGSTGGRPADPLYAVTSAVNASNQEGEERGELATDQTDNSTCVGFVSSGSGDKSSLLEAVNALANGHDLIEVTL